MNNISTGIILLNNAFQVSEQNTQSSHQASVNWGISWLSLASCVLIFFFIPAIRNQNTCKCSVELWNWAVKWLAMFISIVLLHCCMQIYATYFNGVTSSKLTNTEIAVVEDLPQPHFFLIHLEEHFAAQTIPLWHLSCEVLSSTIQHWFKTSGGNCYVYNYFYCYRWKICSIYRLTIL